MREKPRRGARPGGTPVKPLATVFAGSYCTVFLVKQKRKVLKARILLRMLLANFVERPVSRNDLMVPFCSCREWSGYLNPKDIGLQKGPNSPGCIALALQLCSGSIHHEATSWARDPYAAGFFKCVQSQRRCQLNFTIF